MKYTLKEIRPKVFLISCQDQYDLNMLFLRYQEYYESPNTKFRRKSFEIIDFMEWYSKNISKHKSFTYAEDWSGFNFDRSVLDDFYSEYVDLYRRYKEYQKYKDYVDIDYSIKDYNKYDDTMQAIYNQCLDRVEFEEKFYLIGANNPRTIRHELSHAFFYLRPEYKKESTTLVKNLNIKLREKFNVAMKDIGYTKAVFVDEIVAFTSTGIPDSFKISIKDKEREQFIKLFNKHYNQK